MSALVRGLAIEERALVPSDEANRIDHRFKISGPNMLVYVIHVAKSTARWSGPAYYICSCDASPDHQPEDGHAFCEHVTLIREVEASGPRSAT